MNVEEFEGCCTARIFTDLGDSRTSEFGYHAASYDRLRTHVVNGILEAAEDEGAGIITAIVTSEQVTGAKVLKDLGFIGTGMASKTRHKEVQIELYYLHCKDWVEPERPADIVAPEAPVAAPQPFAAARNPAPQAVLQEARVEAPVRPRDDNGRFVAGRLYHATGLNGRLVTKVNANWTYNTHHRFGEPVVFNEQGKAELQDQRNDRGYPPLTFQPI